MTRIITIIVNTYYFYQASTTFQAINLNKKLNVYVECVAGFHQCVFRHNRLIAAQICVYLQTQGDKCEGSGIIFYGYL